jgi:hypothetical protein
MKRGKIINFEMLHIDEGTRYDAIISELIKAKEEGFTTVFGLLLMDGFLYRNAETYPVDIEVILIPGMCEGQAGIPFNYTHRMVYNSFRDVPLPMWNPDSSKFLFLGGVPSRVNRINLLSKFYDTGLLSKSIWSFFPPWTEEDKVWCRNSLKHYSDDQYEAFLDICSQSVDNRYELAKNYSKVSPEGWEDQQMGETDWVKDIAWVHPSIFSHTVLSVISEGNAYPPATNFRFLTEKTWRAIFMEHPFVFAGYPEQFDYAKSLDLRTFEDYMLIKDYAYIEDENARMEAVVANTKYFLEHFKKNKSAIRADVQHNYEIAISIGEAQDDFFRVLNTEYNIPAGIINHWFNQPGFSHLVKVNNAN